MDEICRKTLEQAYLFLDGEILSSQERATIEHHLHRCAPCYERYGFDELVVSLTQRLRQSCRCPDNLKSRITSLLQNF